MIYQTISKPLKTTVAFVFVLFLYSPGSAQELPLDILADKLLLEATRALDRGDQDRALMAFRDLDALESEPPMFAYLYGKALVQHGTNAEAWRKGHALLTEFVVGIGRDSEHYNPTLELILTAEDRLAAADEQVQFMHRLPEILNELNSGMVRVEGGTFEMGCTPEQEKCGADEKPVRTVHINTFEIGKYEVTQALWQSVMGVNPSAFANCPQCPVETVSWDDTQLFFQKLNADGGAYRLPSEAEWEYAARGGRQSQGYQYAGGNNWAEVAWNFENAGNKTNPTGTKKPNELNLFDMSGNVREWVQDCWHDGYNGAPNAGQAWEEGDCDRRVIRSGSWYGKPSYVRSANRFWYKTFFRNNNLGFRIALTPQ